jgi:hypothetical protein
VLSVVSNIRFLNLFYNLGWRADCKRHHDETINAVRSTANEQVHFIVHGYLDEFSKALATEVHMLLGEVGKIREERRALQQYVPTSVTMFSRVNPFFFSEIGDLLSMKAKYGPGGEYEPEWKPPGPPGPPPGADVPPPPMPDIPDVPSQVKPAWRTVHPRPKKKKKNAEAQAHAQAHPVASTSAPPMAHVVRYPDPSTQMRGSWAAWQRE